MTIPDEKWLTSVDYPKYEVSNLGRVRRAADKLLLKVQHKKRTKKSLDYGFVELTKNRVTKRIAVHRLVARTFLKQLPGRTIVNHIDGNKYNNRLDNLEYVNASENAIHAVRMGLNRCLGSSPVTKTQYRQVTQQYNEFVNLLALRYKITPSIVKGIIYGKKYKSLFLK